MQKPLGGYVGQNLLDSSILLQAFSSSTEYG